MSILEGQRQEIVVAAENTQLWQAILDASVDTPVYKAAILSRIDQAKQKSSPLTLFVPWGIRPSGCYGEPEEKTLDILDKWSSFLRDSDIPNKPLIMPADLYAIEVNRADPIQVAEYSAAVSQAAIYRGFSAITWSSIRQANATKYQQLKQYFRAELIANMFPARTLFKAVETARKRSGFLNETEIRQAALVYIQERLIEAEIIENQFRPVKISMVSPVKDLFDLGLPRIYIIPTDQRFPWLK